MHFQHPELLYALFLLIIPIIVHLFRLRKFQREDFTNVKFLKKVIQETRKSSRLKKFLILCTRLLLLACLILAFAQPYIPASERALNEVKTLIYLDNSFSMQAKDAQTSIFQKAINHLLENLNTEDRYAIFTNTSEYFNRTNPDLRDELQNIEFTQRQAGFSEIKLRAENYFKAFPQAEKELVIISDFQKRFNFPAEVETEDFTYHLIPLAPDNFKNVSIDSAFISESTPESILLKLNVHSDNLSDKPVSVSVFDAEKLLGRNTVQFTEENSMQLEFRLQNQKIANGKIEIEDSGLSYDNSLYFNIDESPEIKVVIISEETPGFLQRIYTEPEFETSIFKPNQIDFNRLNSANLIVLNEIDQLPSSLVNNLGNVKDNGASVIIIPAVEAENYNSLLNNFGFSGFSEKIETERLITSISFDHPLLTNVFENRIENFEYPKVLSSYNLASGNSILRYQDNRPFLLESNSVYLFTAALNQENSNFRNSPLIVPVFYQIGLESLKKNRLYYKNGTDNSIDIPVELGKDRVLHIKKEESNLIPQQQNFSNRVQINTGNLTLEAGNYEISNENNTVGNISFNYDRQESELDYLDIRKIENANTYETVQDYFSNSNAAGQITALWKWFVIFALVFLAIEMLLIKFFK